MIKLKGEVEIIGKENGNVIYYDKGANLVTYWARHSVMHLLTGDTFAKSGEKRSDTTHTETLNPDGTLLSNQQYFHANVSPDYDENFYWNKSTLGNSYPFMPVKMLLGTGLEYQTYADLQNDGGVDEWGSLATFETNITNPLNSNYSNILIDYNTLPVQARTVNSNSTTIKTEPEITQNDYAITGAIKNGGYENESDKATKTVFDVANGRILTPELRGVGEPCFVYPLRGSATFEQNSSQVMLTPESVTPTDEIESKITFTVVLPEQTGDNSDDFYPYNGYTIKEVGLFSDAHMFIENSHTVYDKRMPYGSLFAKRYVAPFTKTANSSFTIRWTIYI